MLSKIKAILSLDNKSFNSNLKDSQNKVNDFGGQLQNIVKGGAFLLLANQVKKLGEELIKITNLSVDISNSSRAFDRLGISIQNLRRNTGGMVDDLTLMHRAIVANNLGLNVRNLGEYFKFATIRASETGESVDYLVNSIVLGLGRQSIKILDNLGISQKRLNDELKKGLEYEEAVVKIIKDELSKTNTTLEDTIKGGERLKSTWQNLLGELSESQFFKDLNDGLIRLTKFLEEIRQIRQITGKSFTIKDGAVGIAQYFSSISDDVRKLVEDISTLEEKIKDTNDEVELEKLKKDLKSVRSYLQDIVLGEEEFNNVVKYTNGLEDLLNKKIEKLKSGTGEVVDGFMTIEKITNRINSLKLILNTADSEEEIISLNKELKDLEYELNRLKKIG
ncbi:MAG: hypothetical protein KC589_05065, partial [Nanoarchaeota archaeon]|nr:hypothetical protein [Nanoarchaeota archaeon]